MDADDGDDHDDDVLDLHLVIGEDDKNGGNDDGDDVLCF